MKGSPPKKRAPKPKVVPPPKVKVVPPALSLEMLANLTGYAERNKVSRRKGLRGAIIRGDFPATQHHLVKPFEEGDLLAFAEKIGETGERQLTQLRRLNDFFGRYWLWKYRHRSQTDVRPYVLNAANGKPRSPGAKFFKVASLAAWKSVRKGRLTNVGWMWIFREAWLISPMPRMRQIKCFPVLPTRKKRKLIPKSETRSTPVRPGVSATVPAQLPKPRPTETRLMDHRGRYSSPGGHQAVSYSRPTPSPQGRPKRGAMVMPEITVIRRPTK